MRTLGWLAFLAACGSSSDDRPDGGGGGPDGASAGGSCDAPQPFGHGITPSRTLYVEANAVGGGDGSQGAPFSTIEAAAAVATPGTWIRLGPGMHATDQYTSGLQGSETAPIWLGGDPTLARPVIAGGAEAIHLTRARYVVVRHLEVHGQSANGINMDDEGMVSDETAAHHVTVQNVYIHDIGSTGNQDCLKVSGVHDVFVYDSRFARCGGGGAGSGIDHVGTHRAVIARNLFESMAGNAVQAKGGSTDIDIRQNRVHNGGERAFNMGGSTGLQFFRPPLSMSTSNAEARRIRAFNNVITGTMSAGFGFVGCIDCLAAHNLVMGSPRWLVRILQETVTQGGYTFEPAGNGRVINNSFIWQTGTLSTHVNVGGNTAPDTFTFAHNAWLAQDNPGQSTPQLPVNEIASVIGMPSAYADVPMDPTASLPDFACETGAEINTATSLPEINGTIIGSCRDTGTSQPTIGPQVNALGGC